MPPVPKSVVVKDPEWLAEVRQRPCILKGFPGHTCGDTIGNNPSEASHLAGKSRDDLAVPMCGVAHRTGKDAWHQGMRSFCLRWNLYKDELIHEAEAQYAAYRNAMEGQ